MKISSSRTGSWLWALACFSISSGAALAAPEGERSAPPAERALELELELARKPSLYLVALLGEARLEIKARGLVLDSLELADVAVTSYQPAGADRLDPAAGLPVVRTVVESDLDAARKVVVVDSLAPYPSDGGREEPPDASPAVGAASPAVAPSAAVRATEPPAAYRVRLDAGWELRIGQRATRPPLFERLLRLIVDSWRRLRGETPAARVILSLAMAPDDSRRIHHLLDRGSVLLVR